LWSVEGANIKILRQRKIEDQGFIIGKQLRNLWYGRCLEAWKQRKNRGGSKIECAKCGREDTIIERKISKEEKGKILCPECRTGKRKPWWD